MTNERPRMTGDVDPAAPHFYTRDAAGTSCAYCTQPPDAELHMLAVAAQLRREIPPDALQRAMDVLIEHFSNFREYWAETQAAEEKKLDLSYPDHHQPPGYWETVGMASSFDDVVVALLTLRDSEIDGD